MRRIGLAALGVVLVVAGCSSEDGPGTTTEPPATTTTLPPATTVATTATTTVLTVNACGLLRPRQLEEVLDEPGDGEAAEPPMTPPEGGGPLGLLQASCAWPSLDDARLELSYLAPTTAPDGPSHLRDVLELDTGFAEGGRVVSEEVGAETVGILLDGNEDIRELAVVHGSALVYLIVNQDISGRDLDAYEALKEMVVTALARAPR